MDTHQARVLWRRLEPIHGIVYFAPDATARFEAVGLKGFWMGYFASRAAALGPVGPELVEATFYVFHPAMVARALPDAWGLSTPEAVLKARYELATTSLRDALGDLAGDGSVETAVDLAVAAAQTAPRAGHPLGAAHAALPVPDGDPVTRLWWAATVLREHRFDGHVAALLTAGIGACESLILAAASGSVGPDGARVLQTSRKWPDDEWATATDRLRKRGWLDGAGALTDAGHAGHQEVEAATDRAATAAYASLADDEAERLAEALRPLAQRIAASGALPFPNPIGLDPSRSGEPATPVEP